jgi:SNF family Na+-dependent transporter
VQDHGVKRLDERTNVTLPGDIDLPVLAGSPQFCLSRLSCKSYELSFLCLEELLGVGRYALCAYKKSGLPNAKWEYVKDVFGWTMLLAKEDMIVMRELECSLFIYLVLKIMASRRLLKKNQTMVWFRIWPMTTKIIFVVYAP